MLYILLVSFDDRKNVSVYLIALNSGMSIILFCALRSSVICMLLYRAGGE